MKIKKILLIITVIFGVVIITALIIVGYFIFQFMLHDVGPSAETYAALRTGDPSHCENLNGAWRSRDACYTVFAGSYPNLSICDNILKDKDVCYYNVATGLNDRSICYLIKDSSWKDFCNSHIAFALKDSNICSRMSDKGGQNFCYFVVAEKLSNLSICYLITDEKVGEEDLNYRQLCFEEVAKSLKNSTVCELITNNRIKERCYDDVEKQKTTSTTISPIEYCDSNDDCILILGPPCRVCPHCGHFLGDNPLVMAVNKNYGKDCPEIPENLACILCVDSIDFSGYEARCIENNCVKILSLTVASLFWSVIRV